MPLQITKEKEKVLRIRKQRKLEHVTANIEFVADVSGSMHSEYNPQRGAMKTILQRALAAASVMDPDQQLRLIAFSTSAKDMGPFDTNDFDTLIDVFQKEQWMWGGTDYSSAFELLNSNQPATKGSAKKATEDTLFGKVMGFFAKKPAVVEPVVVTEVKPTQKVPRLVMFFTDGADGGSENSLMREVQKLIDTGDTFVMLVGVGGSRATYSLLESIDDKFFGVDFIHFNDITKLDNDSFYETLLSDEFTTWVTRFQETNASAV